MEQFNSMLRHMISHKVGTCCSSCSQSHLLQQVTKPHHLLHCKCHRHIFRLCRR
ncbi:hypothetical protein Plhal304r1_c029g0095251 [Plasmopara halstedii]